MFFLAYRRYQEAKGKRQKAIGKRQRAALFSPHPTPHTPTSA
ncbi:hypothetical protein O53_5082 [Microcystis aeruginosa TAIHU98]|uniref:Uncharacterized protein n=1 Tax=Microcystis aeruginosa TAIHU98 TaxID=1134457 RepID=L7E1M4_MICAE|nr:hypothetical protein O53_5082 [Microcystis aeruginosa TAIHU98]